MIKKIRIFDSPQGQTKLISYSKSISLNCKKFIQRLLLTVNHQEQCYTNDDYLSMLEFCFKYKKVQSAPSMCRKVILKGEEVFKCLTCQIVPNSISCKQCFSKGNHKAHNFFIYRTGGGYCDCGIEHAWKSEGNCLDHQKREEQIVIQEQQVQVFINEMKFVLTVIYLLDIGANFQNSIQVGSLLRSAFAMFLLKFNQDSHSNNEICFRFLKTNFDEQKIESWFGLERCVQNVSVFKVIVAFVNDDNFMKIMKNVFCSMFTRKQFKKYFTRQFTKIMATNWNIFYSQLFRISSELYSDHSNIKQLIEEQKFKPISMPSNQNWSSQNTWWAISLYFKRLRKLITLVNGVGKKYCQFHLRNANICDLSTAYENHEYHMKKKVNQLCLLQNYMKWCILPMLKQVKDNKEILLKAIKDITLFLKHKKNKTISFFMSKERTLIAFIYSYFDGQIQKARHQKFLQMIGLTTEIIHRILQTVIKQFHFGSQILSNNNAYQQFKQYTSFMFLESKLFFSLDSQLFKFCLLSLNSNNQFQIKKNQKLNITEVSLFDEEIYESNKLPISLLLWVPLIQIKAQNQSQFPFEKNKFRQNFDCLNCCIGLLLEIIMTNHSQLNLRYWMNCQKPNEMNWLFGCLLKSLKNPKIKDFVQICKNFFSNQDMVELQNFIEANCKMENKRIKLLTDKQNQFQSFNLGYLQSKAIIQELKPYFEENQKEINFNKTPIAFQNDHGKEDERVNLISLVFHQNFMATLKDVFLSTLKLIEAKEKEDHIQTEFLSFAKFVEQIIKLNYLFQNQILLPLISTLISTLINEYPSLYEKIPQHIKREAQLLQGRKEQDSKVSEVSQRKSKLADKKTKKLEKLKQKQKQSLKALENMIELSPQISQQERESQVCLFCKLSNQKQTLSFICFTQNTNLFSSLFLGSNRQVTLIVTCGHQVHSSCHYNSSQTHSYFLCDLCKTVSNQLVCQTGLLKRKSMQKKNLNKIVSSSQQKVETIALSILYAVFIDENFFFKSLLKPCISLFKFIATQQNNYKSLLHSLKSQYEDLKLSQDQIEYWSCYFYCISSIALQIGLNEHDKVQYQTIFKQSSSKISAKLGKSILNALSFVKSTNFFPQNLQSIQVLKPSEFRSLPLSLDKLSEQMGECPNCNEITNKICVCFLCEFKSCFGCKKLNLTDHAICFHPQGTVFICTNDGSMLYVVATKNSVIENLYQNVIGQHYIETKIFCERKNKDEFKINLEELKKMRDDIIYHRILQKIMYKQYMTKRVSNLNP